MDSLSLHEPRRFAPMPRRFAMALLTLILGVAAIGCGSGEEASLNGMTRQPPINVGEAGLPQTNPKREADGDRIRAGEDGLMLVFFGYTYCPDVCPTTLADLRIALADLSPEERSRVEVGMVTVDPARDTPKALNGYLAHFFDRDAYAAFVPADRRELAEVEKAFGVTHRLEKPDADGNYAVEHSAQVFAVDEDGEVLVEWPFGDEPENITADIRLLLSRIDAAEKKADDS